MRTTKTDRVLAVQASLTGRDIRLLSWLADHGVLTTPQIVEALFPSTSFGQRRLLRLRGLGVVDRFRPQKLDGGSHPYHWVLDQLGVEVICAQRGETLPRPGLARARRLHLTSKANLGHLLGVNGFFTALTAHARTRPGAALVRWWPAARFHGEASFYRVGDDLSVLHLSTRVCPDGHGVWVENRDVVPFFLEYDTGTEPLGTLVDKVDRYRLLVACTQRQWPTLFLLPSARRELNLHHRLATEYGPGGLRVATTAVDLLAATGRSVAEHVWWLAGEEGDRRRLAGLPASGPDLHGAAPITIDAADNEHHEQDADIDVEGGDLRLHP